MVAVANVDNPTVIGRLSFLCAEEWWSRHLRAGQSNDDALDAFEYVPRLAPESVVGEAREAFNSGVRALAAGAAAAERFFVPPEVGGNQRGRNHGRSRGAYLATRYDCPCPPVANVESQAAEAGTGIEYEPEHLKMIFQRPNAVWELLSSMALKLVHTHLGVPPRPSGTGSGGGRVSLAHPFVLAAAEDYLTELVMSGAGQMHSAPPEAALLDQVALGLLSGLPGYKVGDDERLPFCFDTTRVDDELRVVALASMLMGDSATGAPAGAARWVDPAAALALDIASALTDPLRRWADLQVSISRDGQPVVVEAGGHWACLHRYLKELTKSRQKEGSNIPRKRNIADIQFDVKLGPKDRSFALEYIPRMFRVRDAAEWMATRGQASIDDAAQRFHGDWAPAKPLELADLKRPGEIAPGVLSPAQGFSAPSAA